MSLVEANQKQIVEITQFGFKLGDDGNFEFLSRNKDLMLKDIHIV